MRGAGVAETQAADRGVWHWQQEIRDKALSCNESRCVAELHCTPAHNTVRVCVPVQTAGSVRMKNLSDSPEQRSSRPQQHFRRS